MQEIAGTEDQARLCDASGWHVLQELVWPDPEVHPDPALCFRLGGGVSVAGRELCFEPGGVVGLDTAFNLFSWLKWHRVCGIDHLGLAVRGTGRFVLEVAAEAPGGRQVLCCEFDLPSNWPTTLDLTDWLAGRGDSVLSLTLRAVTAGRIVAIDWVTPQAPRRRPRLLLCVTTFRRPEAATATARRLSAALCDHPLADLLHLLIVDNDRSLSLPPLPHVTLIGNRNLGGAGGFARGLAEAIARGDTHCLFMDDDAWVDMGSILRTWTFLAHATDPAVAIAGALTRADAPTVVWENGAVFTGRCRFLFTDLNLLDAEALTAAEFAYLAPPLPNLYGAFWYFAFPIAAVRHWPFPFFVRGDDVNFSIVNPFRILTLPGVISYQAQDFADKDSALVQYLSLRCDLLQILLLPHMPRRRIWALRAPASFFLRLLVLARSESLQALNLAVEDVLRGPGHIAAHADVADRRAEIAALRRREVWRPLSGPPPPERRRIDPASRWQRLAMQVSLNGLLLPFFAGWGNHVTLPRTHRRLVSQCWGAAQITLLSPDGTEAMTLRQDKPALLREGLRMVWNLIRLMAGYRGLRRRWLADFPHLTSQAFWQDQFKDPPGPR
ncbi:glycosyl transferase [bacterium]|nr:glycosyl transferase [bacterium]